MSLIHTLTHTRMHIPSYTCPLFNCPHEQFMSEKPGVSYNDMAGKFIQKQEAWSCRLTQFQLYKEIGIGSPCTC